MTNSQIELLGGAILGHIFRRVALQHKERMEERGQLHEQRMAELDVVVADRNAARGMAGGTLIRRFIAFSIFAFVCWALYFFAYTDLPIQVGETVERSGGILRDIFGGAKEKLKFHEVHGLVLHPEHWTVVRALIGFYFGQSIK